MSATLPNPSELAAHWDLDPNTVYLNHGSFGATPRRVREAQHRLQNDLEREPVRFFVEKHESAMDRSRKAIAPLLGCPWDQIAPIPNATTGVATVLASVIDQRLIVPGDELLATSHEYPACLNNLRRAARQAGASLVTVELPFPVRSPDEILDRILTAITPRTRLALISHITAASGMRLPVERLAPELESRGVRVLIDGAHAPGMVDVNLSTLGATWYTGNCHKWICSPKGSAILWARDDVRYALRPLVLSIYADLPKPGRDRFLTEFDYQGTSDPSAFASVADAVECMNALVPDGWTEIRRRNHDLCLAGRDILCQALRLEPPVPDDMLGSISTLTLPAASKSQAAATRYHDPLQDALVDRHHIQVPVWSLPNGTRCLRISAQLYNSLDQYRYLADALTTELRR